MKYIATTEQLRTLAHEAKLLGCNRTLEPEVEAKLDPDGMHVIVTLMLHEWGAGKPIETHFRVRALLKLTGTMDPYEILLDLPLDMRKQLTAIDRFPVTH